MQSKLEMYAIGIENALLLNVYPHLKLLTYLIQLVLAMTVNRVRVIGKVLIFELKSINEG